MKIFERLFEWIASAVIVLTTSAVLGLAVIITAHYFQLLFDPNYQGSLHDWYEPGPSMGLVLISFSAFQAVIILGLLEVLRRKVLFIEFTLIGAVACLMGLYWLGIVSKCNTFDGNCLSLIRFLSNLGWFLTVILLVLGGLLGGMMAYVRRKVVKYP